MGHAASRHNASVQCVGSTSASVPFESAHPYRNGSDCTWIYHNGSAGFSFHFSVLDTEAGFDRVVVLDDGGHVLASYSGTYRKAVTSPCIPGETGSIRLTSDNAVTAQGFIVDSIVAC